MHIEVYPSPSVAFSLYLKLRQNSLQVWLQNDQQTKLSYQSKLCLEIISNYKLES